MVEKATLSHILFKKRKTLFMAKKNMQKGKKYTCPMHPEVQNDQPGNCPKCGMKLVEKDKQKTNKRK